VLGMLWTGSRSVGFTLNGKLMGPPLPFAAESGFCFVKFDAIANQAVQLVTSRRVPIDRRGLCCAASSYKPRQSIAPLVVRTIGPDSRTFCLTLCPTSTTLAALCAAVAPLLGEGIERVELRIDGLCFGAQHQTALCDRTLAELGVRAEHNGCHMNIIEAHVPHLIS